MKTIEERAKEYALRYDDKWQVAMFKAYIEGATEQKQIDDQQLCEYDFEYYINDFNKEE